MNVCLPGGTPILTIGTTQIGMAINLGCSIQCTTAVCTLLSSTLSVLCVSTNSALYTDSLQSLEYSSSSTYLVVYRVIHQSPDPT